MWSHLLLSEIDGVVGKFEKDKERAEAVYFFTGFIA
jgi:hypothetical protein